MLQKQKEEHCISLPDTPCSPGGDWTVADVVDVVETAAIHTQQTVCKNDYIYSRELINC